MKAVQTRCPQKALVVSRCALPGFKAMIAFAIPKRLEFRCALRQTLIAYGPSIHGEAGCGHYPAFRMKGS